MINKILMGAVLAGSLVLAGCASDDVEKEGQAVTLEQRVDVLEQDVRVLDQKVDAVADEAGRANQRLDNQATSYRK